MTARQPPEWAPHEFVWIGFPSHAELWKDDLESAREQVAAFAAAVHAGGKGEEVRIVAADPDAAKAAEALAPFATIVQEPFGDIWLRDTGPIFGAGSTTAAAFRFNGWGGKYELEHDDTVAEQISAASGVPLDRHDFILEGGALEHDGQGTILTTRQCLLNPNRNPGWTEAKAEAALKASLGARKMLWLGDGLLNDHTDGHVDNLARFVAPGVVACPVAWGRGDRLLHLSVGLILLGLAGGIGLTLRQQPDRLRSAPVTRSRVCPTRTELVKQDLTTPSVHTGASAAIGASASATALAMQTGTLMQLPSANPFAPSGVNGDGDS